MRVKYVGIATDHGGFALKAPLMRALRFAGYEITDFGASCLLAGDDYPDYVVPPAQAVRQGQRGIALCGNGLGTRAMLPAGTFSQGKATPAQAGEDHGNGVARRFEPGQQENRPCKRIRYENWAYSGKVSG